MGQYLLLNLVRLMVNVDYLAVIMEDKPVGLFF